MPLRSKAGRGSPVDVGAVLDSVDVMGAITELLESHAMVSLSVTRDGGALGITVTVDGEWDREYVRSPQELVDHLAEAMPDYRRAIEAMTASAERGSRRRRS